MGGKKERVGEIEKASTGCMYFSLHDHKSQKPHIECINGAHVFTAKNVQIDLN